MGEQGIIAWSFGGFFGALLGVAASHFLSIRTEKKRAKNQQKAYFSEFTLIRDRYRTAIPLVLNDFENPHILSHRLLPDIDFKLIDLFTAQLAITDLVLTENQRKLMMRLKNLHQDIGELNKKRENIDWNPQKYTKQEGHEFRLYTGALLYKAVQIHFFLIKQSSERDNFNFNGEYTLQDCAEISCRDSGVIYDANLWSKVKFFSDQVS